MSKFQILKTYKADLVLLAMGFSGCEEAISKNFGVKLDEKNNISTENFQTTHKNLCLWRC